MKIRFTMTLSDETVNAFKACGSEDGEAVKNAMVGELRSFLARVKRDADQIDADEEPDDDDEDDDEEEDEEVEDVAPPKRPPSSARRSTKNTKKTKK